MARRGNLEGSVRRRSNGRWEGRILLPDGTRKSVYGPSQENVVDQITELRTRIKSEMPLKTATESTQIICEAFLIHISNMGTRPQTIDVYRSKLKSHIYPFVGQTPLSHVKTSDIQNIIDSMVASKLKASTVRTTIALFRAAFSWAKTKFALQSDPFLSAQLPRHRDAVMRYVQPNEIKKFLSIPMAPAIKIATTIAIKTGLRRGEVLGLKWDDINWDLKQLRVVRSYSPRGTGRSKTPDATKTKSSEGIVYLSDDLIDDLKEYRIVQQAIGNPSKGYVIATKNGDPMEPTYLSSQYNKAIEKHWHTHIRFHDLRHTHATSLLASNVGVRTIQERLRWSSMAMMGRYAHVTEEMHRDAVDKISKLYQ